MQGIQGAQGPRGLQGEQGDQGPAGLAGANGIDGVTPSVDVSTSASSNGTTVTITINGEDTVFFVSNGTTVTVEVTYETETVDMGTRTEDELGVDVNGDGDYLDLDVPVNVIRTYTLHDGVRTGDFEDSDLLTAGGPAVDISPNNAPVIGANCM